MEYPKDTVKKPQYFGHLTNDIIYKRLAPSVLDELESNTQGQQRKAQASAAQAADR